MNYEKIEKIEKRFKIVTGINYDLSVYPIKEDVQFETNKEKSRDFAEVFTPLNIVDKMIGIVPNIDRETKSIDLCAGHGHFTTRLMRRLFDEYDEYFNAYNFLYYKHLFNEIQISSCCKLLWIFGDHINLAIGDALQLAKLPNNARGIWYWFEEVDSWVDLTKIVRSIFKKSFWGSNFKKYSESLEKRFINSFEEVINSCIRFIKESFVNKKELGRIFGLMARTKEGRENMRQTIAKFADKWDDNWQNVETPEDIAKEMINTIPEIEQKKILVLFNIEFIELLIYWKKIDPANICYGFDSRREGDMVEGVYGVKGIYIGKDIELIKDSLQGIEGKYDVVLSNPPYQVQSEKQKENKINKSLAQPVYNKIVEYTIDYLKPEYICMITPSRWMVGGQGLNDYRDRMLNDNHLRLIEDFRGNKDIFKDVDISSGVSYFLWEKKYQGLCKFNGIYRKLNQYDVLVRDNLGCQILEKVLGRHEKFCNESVFSQKPFGLSTNHKEWSNNTEDLKCYCPIRDGFFKYVKKEKIKDNHNILGKWKVFVPMAGVGGNSYKDGNMVLISQIFIGEPFSVCTETYIVSNVFESLKEADNYAAYIRTKFYRFMLLLRICNQAINKDKFAWVPDMVDYTHKYTDNDLYKHFELTKKEIEHIEKSIKEIV